MAGVVTRATKGAPINATEHDDNLSAIVTLHKGSTEPSPTYACMLWADTATSLLKQRNVADSAWVTLGSLDSSTAFISIADDGLSGDKIDGGTISDFASTGIDDNATSTAITIDSNNRLFTGRTSEISTQSGNVFQGLGGSYRALDLYRATDTTGADIFRVYSDVGGSETNVAIIEANGDFQSATGSYGTTSDERIKTQITDANNQWQDISAIRLRNYKLKNDVAENGDDALLHLGVIAQELEEAGMSGLVAENEDGVKCVKTSIMLLKALGALQEAMSRIEALEAQLNE